MNTEKHCCKKLWEVSSGLQMVGDEICFDGCCGGCFVLVDMKYCPFCSLPLSDLIKTDDTSPEPVL